MKEDFIKLIGSLNDLLNQHSQTLQEHSGKVIGESKEAFEAIEAFATAIVETDDLLEAGEALISKLEALKPEDWNDRGQGENKILYLDTYRNDKTGRVRKAKFFRPQGLETSSSIVTLKTHTKINR